MGIFGAILKVGGNLSGKSAVASALSGGAINTGVELGHEVAEGDVSATHLATAFGVGTVLTAGGEAVGRKFASNARGEINKLDDATKWVNKRKGVREGEASAADKDLGKLNAAYDEKRAADAAWNSRKLKNIGANKTLKDNQDIANAKLRKELGKDPSPDATTLQNDIAARQKVIEGRKTAAEGRAKVLGERAEKYGKRKEPFEKRANASMFGARTGGLTLAGLGTWVIRPGGDDSGGSDGSGGDAGGKSKGGADGTPVDVSWAGGQYMDTPPKEPIAPDPQFTVSGPKDGFLLTPAKGLSPQLKAWYVG